MEEILNKISAERISDATTNSSRRGCARSLVHAFSRTSFLRTSSIPLQSGAGGLLIWGLSMYVLWGKMMWKSYELKYQKALSNDLQACTTFTKKWLGQPACCSWKLRSSWWETQRLLNLISVSVLLVENYHSAFLWPNFTEGFVSGPPNRKNDR